MRNQKTIIEHEPMVTTTYGTFPQSQVAEIIKAAKQKEAENMKKEAEERAKRPPLKRCPFSNGMNTTCRGELCALFVGYVCALVTGAAVNENRYCPFGDGYQPCGVACALYIDGHCALSRKEI